MELIVPTFANITICRSNFTIVFGSKFVKWIWGLIFSSVWSRYLSSYITMYKCTKYFRRMEN